MRKQTRPKLTVTLPFTDDDFIRAWDNWKQYRVEQFGAKKQYKSVRGEQAQLAHLFNISGGDKDKAISIIHNSMANTWQGLWLSKSQQDGRQGATKTRDYTGGFSEFDKMYSGR